MHKNVLGRSSPFFQSALKPEWTDPIEPKKPIDLPDTSVASFKVYLQWLYWNTVPEAKKGTEDVHMLAHAYVLGVQILDENFQNAIMRNLKRSFLHGGGNIPSAQMIEIIYEGTNPGSHIRDFMVQLFLGRRDHLWQNNPDIWPAEFLRDLFEWLIIERTDSLELLTELTKTLERPDAFMHRSLSEGHPSKTEDQQK